MDTNTTAQLNDRFASLRAEMSKAYDEGDWQRALQLSREIDAYQLNLWSLQAGDARLSV